MDDTKLTEAGGHVPARRPADASRVTLVVYDDAARPPTTTVIPLANQAEVTVGRSRAANVMIDSEQISRIHATFSRNGMEITVADAGSRNGTWVNGEQIAAPRRLASGDEVVVGPATIALSITTGTVARSNLESTRYLDERLAAEVDRGLHYQRSFGLAMISFAGPQEAIDAATDLVSSSLRPMEVLAEYAPGVLAIVMPELDAASTERAAQGLFEKVAASDPTLSVAIGVAGFPEHSTAAAGLIARARAALETVRATGKDGIGGPPAEDAVPALGDVVVVDPKMARIHEHLRKVAEHSITVLISGETGVGKEVIAGALHAASGRRGPLIRINCASLPESLLESELFGHERGAFTGADRRKSGYFEAAHGGTLFLDEIGEMTPALQAKLLRVLEQRRITRVGGVEEVEVNVRVICATHRDLEAECRRNAFRSDLYFRISAFTIVVPPLRERPLEIEHLARTFLQQSAVLHGRATPALSQGALDALRRYSWPGNVRELRNAIERALVLHIGGTIGLEDLPDAVRDARGNLPGPMAGPEIVEHGLGDIRAHLATLERDAITAALEAASGNQTEAAKQLGISRRTLIYRMEKYGLKPLPPAKRDLLG